jgi:cobalt/nickel transport system permease protein
MHISEGILSGSVLATGGVLAASGTIIGLRDMKGEDFVKVSLLSSSFFVASLIHVPVGPSSAHLVLNGLCGIILGWKSFPAILVSLFLQAILFQFGGLTTLGVNTCNMAIPCCHFLLFIQTSY